jgi:O-antigen ligase
VNILLIYFLLFTFLVERSLGFKLTQSSGLSLMNLSIYLLLVAWLYKIALKRKILISNNINKYLILIMFIGLFSIFFKYWEGEVQIRTLVGEFKYLKTWSNPFILFFVILNIINDKTTCKNAILGMLVLMVFSVLNMLMDKFGFPLFSLIKHTSFIDDRMAGFGNPNAYAIYLTLFLPIVLTFILFGKNILIKAINAIIYVVTITGLFITGSRGGFVSLLISLFVYFSMAKKDKLLSTHTILLIGALLGLFVFVGFLAAPPETKSVVIERFDPRNSEDFGDFTSGRTERWHTGLQLFFEKPIFGHGQGTYVSHSHNAYLSWMIQYGMVGLIAYLMIFTKVFFHAWQHYRTSSDVWLKQLYMSYLSGFTGWMVAMFSGALGTPFYMFWVYTAIMYRYPLLETIPSQYHPES